MKKYTLAILPVALAAVAVSGLAAAPTSKDPVEVTVANAPLAVVAALEPVQVCSPVYNPTIAYTVPADRLLVIEDATVSATLDPGETMVGILETLVGGAEADHYVGSISGDDFLFARDGRTMKVYADPGTDVVIKAARRNAPENMKVCFSGHLEVIPAAP